MPIELLLQEIIKQVKELESHLSCAVCFDPIKSACLTTCGHRFCSVCVKDCVNQHKRCPICNTELTLEQIFSDHSFDVIVRQVKDVTSSLDKVENSIFSELIINEPIKGKNSANKEGTSSRANTESDEVFKFAQNKLKGVLTKNLKSSYLQFQQFFNSIFQNYEKSKVEIEKLNDSESNKLIEEFKNKKLRKILENSIESAVDSYDHHLQNHLPDLSILPVRLCLSVLPYEIVVPDILLEADSNLDTILNMLKEQYKNLYERDLELGENFSLFYMDPFVNLKTTEIEKICSDIKEHNAVHPSIKLIDSNGVPVIDLKMQNAGQLLLHNVKEIFVPRPVEERCFKRAFDPNTSPFIDYFTCKDCDVKWICKPCIAVCHDTHTTESFIKGHKPSWACCYCSKKTECILDE